MKRTRAPYQTVLGWILAVLGIALLAAYLVGSFLAYLINFSGLGKLVGFIQPFCGLLLPFIGRGSLFGFDVRSFIWWALIGGGAALIWAVTRGPLQVLIIYRDAEGDARLASLNRFRNIVFSILSQSPPVTADQLGSYIFGPGSMSQDNRLAVQQTLDRLVEEGTIEQFAAPDGRSLYSLREAR